MGPLPEVRDGKRSEMARSKLSGVRARDLMHRQAARVDEEMPLSLVLSMMQQSGADDAVVMNGEKVLGVVSTSHLLKRSDLSLNTKAKRVMISPPGVGPDSDAMEMCEVFIQTRLRDLVVTDAHDRFQGMVTRKDLTRIIADLREFRDVPVDLVMTPSPRSVSVGDTVDAARQLMRDLDVRVVPVVDVNGELEGVIGLRDVTEYIWREKTKQTVGEAAGRSGPAEVSVESAMSRDPVTITPAVPITEVASIMLEEDISTLLVMDDGDPVGVVTEYDLLSLIASFLERDMVLVKISGFEGNQDAYDAIFEEVHQYMVKMAKIEKPRIMDIHVHSQRERGDREAFHLQGRMTTAHRMYYASAQAWDVMLGLNAMLSHVERQVKERKDEYLEWRRHRSG